jgi:hypothetical protein
MRISVEGMLPDTIRALAMGRTNETQAQQSMLAALQSYLSFAYKRDRRAADWPLAAAAGRDFLQVELRTLNSPIALSRFVRRISERSVSETALKADVAAFATKIRNDDEFRTHIRNMMLKDHVGELFEGRHGESFHTYAAKLLAQQEAQMM